jgi:Protein kinase domain
MSSCPHPDRLLRLHSGDLPEIEQTELVAHLDSCPDCRGALDRMAARSGLWNDLALLRADPPGPPTGEWSKRTESVPTDDDEVLVGLLEPPDEPGHLGKLGPYDVLRLIGRGGMGIVVLARDRALERLVAIKLLAPGMAATGAARRRFAREAKAAAAVVHEHVVTIHAVDTLPHGVPYLVMQFISGKSVQELIDRGKVPELAEILRIGSQAACALAAAHAQGLIHRDIKPANILLENGVERVKITDFGLARAVDDVTMTQSGVVAGTPQYMSPEQARGDAVDHRTDLFSLGSVLYALCTGKAPFQASSSMATLKRVCEQTPRSIGQLNRDIPSWLIRIIERLHAKEPAERYESAAEVHELLGRCLAHVQQPASVPLPAELLPARNRGAIALWGAIPVCLLLAGLLIFPGAREAAAQAASYVATVLRLRTLEGTLVVETDDPNVAIKLDGNDLVVTGAGVKELRLSVGRHNVQAIKDGKVLRDELVTISRGGRTILTVRREPEQVKSAQAANHLADVLKRNPPPHGAKIGERMQLYMRDLLEGSTSLIADEPVPGLSWTGAPNWSNDGAQILFDTSPGKDWEKCRLMILEARDNKPSVRDLGAGTCPNVAPDGQHIAFVLNSGAVTGAESGVYVSDGSSRHRIDSFGAPFWSEDGRQILINGFGDPTDSNLYTVSTRQLRLIAVPGHRIFSWPRWAGPGMLVACIGTGNEPDSIVLLDISQPSPALVVETIWRRSREQDVFARWPLFSTRTNTCYFVGVEGTKRTLLSIKRGERGPAVALEAEGHEDDLGGLCLSPDGRYLLFGANRPNRAGSLAPGYADP